MKRFFSIFLTLGMIVTLAACGNKQDGESSAISNAENQTAESTDETAEVPPDSNSEISETADLETDAEIKQAEQNEAEEPESSSAENNQTEQEEESDMTMNIQIGDNVLTATLVQNSSTETLVQMLSEGSITIEMNDYAGMEKVGSFPESLPRNDEQISTGAGDLILYQGNSFVIYYDTNSWNFTRLGRIDNVTEQELMEILGDGSVTAVLSLPTE
ncbi:MAG: cyclophilin-like fold protein [Butyrivibrio sp.]|nr:cyclophilin-like fold protein [Butyrivibrio sp.]